MNYVGAIWNGCPTRYGSEVKPGVLQEPLWTSFFDLISQLINNIINDKFYYIKIYSIDIKEKQVWFDKSVKMTSTRLKLVLFINRASCKTIFESFPRFHHWLLTFNPYRGCPRFHLGRKQEAPWVILLTISTP